MKKITTLAVAFIATALTAHAGGLLTNTNQNAAFLRNFAQEGQITLTSLYANPAGNVFLSPGWHLSLNSQTAIQTRTIDTTFPYFQQNLDNKEKTHTFKGEAFAPIIPSISLSYNQDKWSVSAHFGITGGGGKCEFNDGLGSFESAYSGLMAQLVPAILPSMLQTGIQKQYEAKGVPTANAAAYAAALAATGQYTGYNIKSYMRGRSYYYGLQVGGSYKFMDNLAGYIGVRGVYADCNYLGYVNTIANYSVPANATYQFPGTTGSAPLKDYGIDLNCNQTGFGITPIIGIDWQINQHWNIAAKYEFPTVMNLKNDSHIDIESATVAQKADAIIGKFKDGEKVREDIPAILAAGVEYKPIEAVHLDLSGHYYFDKDAKKYGDAQTKINSNSWELCAGAEWRCCQLLTVSASWQTTNYDMDDTYMNDLSFNLSSHSLGLGVRIHPSKYFNVDLGWMHTMYKERNVTDPNPSFMGLKSDNYKRTNDVLGIGFNIYL